MGYRKIVKIPFFDLYQRWKLFSVWRSAMRNQRVQKCSKTLNAHLFSLDPTLCDSLLKCRTLCVRVSSWNLLEVNPMTVYQLEDFEETQRKVRRDRVKDLDDVWMKIKEELLTSCTVSLDLFLKKNDFKNGFANRKEEDTKEGEEGGEGDRENASGGMSYTERATTRTQCRKLTKFIRIVQYLFNDAIAQMVVHTTTRLLEVLNAFLQEPEEEMAVCAAESEKKEESKEKE